MTHRLFGAAVVLLGLGVAVLAGCAGRGDSGVSNSGISALPAPMASHRGWHDLSRSWMSRDAKKAHHLLYVSDNWTGDVYVFGYPKIKLVGTLTGFYDLGGICTDKKGNVWIPELDDIQEYPHGGTSPISVLSDGNEFANDCSVDRTTGNLAVTNYSTTSGAAGNILVFAGAQGTPQTFTDENMYYYYSLTYDNHGNLFADGTQVQSGGFQFAQLPSGGSAFTNYNLNLPYSWPGGVAWDGQYVTVEDADSSTVYQLSISASGVTEVSSTSLSGLRGIMQYLIPLKRPGKGHQGTQLIAGGSQSAQLGIYTYPAGGAPIETIGSYGNPWVAPVGVALSFK